MRLSKQNSLRVEPLEDRCMPSANVILEWNQLALDAIRQTNASPVVASRALAITQAAIGTFFTPARTALIPSIVKADGLLASNSLSQAGHLIAGVLGTGAAGVIVGVFSVTWPVFASAGHMESLHPILECDATGQPIRFRYDLPANARMPSSADVSSVRAPQFEGPKVSHHSLTSGA